MRGLVTASFPALDSISSDSNSMKDRADSQDGLHLEVLDMRAHVWGVEQDLQKVVKTGQSIFATL